MKELKNKKIRKAMLDADVFYWQIAKELKVTDSNFSKMLRQELDDATKDNILNVIKKIAGRSN